MGQTKHSWKIQRNPEVTAPSPLTHCTPLQGRRGLPGKKLHPGVENSGSTKALLGTGATHFSLSLDVICIEAMASS